MSEFATGWLDTNMILRYLLGEPQDQAQSAAAIIEHSDLILISPVILAESFFVLFTVYRRSRAEIGDSLAGLVNRENIQVSNIEKAFVIEALSMCRDSGRVKVADALLWAEARTSGQATIYTFDRRFPDQGVTLSEVL